MTLMQFKSVIFQHCWAIILALFAALIVAFPQVYFRIDHKDIYQGIELLPDSPWSPRAREVQDGHLNFGAMYYKDGKDLPYLFQPLGSIVVGYMGKVFSLDINNTFLLSRLVLTFIVFILIYCFVFSLARDKLVALCGATVIILAESVLSSSGITQLLHGASPDNFLRIARPVNPAMIYVLFFGFLASFVSFYRQRNWRSGVLSVVLLGLNFYNYFYTWTYLYAFGGFLVLLLLLQKQWLRALQISAIFVSAIPLAIPYALNLYHAMIHPVYHDAAMRFGVIMSHAPLFIGAVATFALLLFFFVFSRQDKDRYFFCLALLLAPILTLNQQVFTGKLLQEAHYHWFFHKPIAIITTLMVLFYLMSRYQWDKYKKLLACIIILISIGIGIFIQAYSYSYDKRDGGNIAVDRQRYGPVMDWLNAHAAKEAVLFGNDETSHLTVIYTPLNLMYHRVAMNSLAATKERLLDVLFTFYRLRNVTRDNAREVFFAERGYISSSLYGIYYRELLGTYETIPDEKIEEVLQLYLATLSTPKTAWLQLVFSKYQVDYMVWDKKADPSWDLARYPFFKQIALFGDLAIYQRI